MSGVDLGMRILWDVTNGVINHWQIWSAFLNPILVKDGGGFIKVDGIFFCNGLNVKENSKEGVGYDLVNN